MVIGIGVVEKCMFTNEYTLYISNKSKVKYSTKINLFYNVTIHVLCTTRYL